MPEFNAIAFPGKYIQGKNLLERLPELLAPLGGRPFIVSTKSFYPAMSALAEKCGGRAERFGGINTYAEVERLASLARDFGADVIAGVGGGNPLDCAKVVADTLGLPVAVCPTTASSDAPCSLVSVMNNENGVEVGAYHSKRNPALVLVDSDICGKAPARFLAAGMADGMATWLEAKSCAATGGPNSHGGGRTLLGLTIARLCYDTILQYGRKAYFDCKRKEVTDEVEKIIEANILLSGTGFESCGIAMPHGIGGNIGYIPRVHGFYHGEKVSFGIMCSLVHNEASETELFDTCVFLHELGLPVTLGEFGLDDISDEDFKIWTEHIFSPPAFINNEPKKCSPESVKRLILETDEYCRGILKI